MEPPWRNPFAPAASGPSQSLGNAPDVPFIDGNRITGVVVDVQSSSTFPTAWGKRALFASDRTLQLSHQYQFSSLFVEPVGCTGDPFGERPQRCLKIAGDIRTDVLPGNTIQATVVERGGALWIKHLNNLSTAAAVRPAGQMSGGAAAAMVLVPMVLLALFLTYAPADVILAVLGALVVPFLLIVALVRIITRPFRRRRRR